LDGGGVGSGHDLGLAQVLGAQRGLDGDGLLGDVAPAGAVKHGADLRGREPGGLGGVEALASSSRVSAASRSRERDQRGRE
jgi:hypothetical protein